MAKRKVKGKVKGKAKKKPKIKMRSYGIYTKWDSESKALPRITEFTDRIPAEIDIEFGFIVKITGAKNQELDLSLIHI